MYICYAHDDLGRYVTGPTTCLLDTDVCQWMIPGTIDLHNDEVCLLTAIEWVC